jgi:hypothetical protein
MSPEPLVLHVLVLETDEGFEVTCLEMNLDACAPTREQAIEDLRDVIRAQYLFARAHQNLDNLFFPAPVDYWRRLAYATPDRLIDLELHEGDEDEATAPPAPVAVRGIKLQELIAAP